MKDVVKRTITGIIFGLGFWLTFTTLPPLYFSALLGAILLQILVFEWQKLFKRKRRLIWFVSPLYPILPFALLIKMNHSPEYRHLLFYLFIIVFSFDVGSYIFGSLLGRHKLAPDISHKKTWEGAAGGYLFACIGFWLMLLEQSLHKPLSFIMLFSFLVCILALAGDLFESFLKRRAHIKDTGTILPGHGGFLDRFDGIMFAVFFFYLLRTYLVTVLQ